MVEGSEQQRWHSKVSSTPLILQLVESQRVTVHSPHPTWPPTFRHTVQFSHSPSGLHGPVSSILRQICEGAYLSPLAPDRA